MIEAYLTAAESAIELLSRPEVATRWDEASALAEWTVGGLAGHLASQITTLHTVVEHPVGDQDRIPLLEHYRRAAWVGSNVDHEVNVAIRETGVAAASKGAAALVATTTEQLGAVRARLAGQPLDRYVVIPWQGWALTLRDFLVTRMMEIVVHSDDLAVSVGVQPPLLPSEVLDPVLALLVGVAVERHGQAAVVRGLTRRERAPESISAF